MDIDSPPYLPSRVVSIGSGVARRIGITRERSADVPLIVLHSSVRPFAAQQPTLDVVTINRALTQCIGDALQIATSVVTERRPVAGTVDVLDELPEVIPAKLFALASGIDDLDHLTAFVVAVLSDIPQRVGLVGAVAASVVAILPAVACCVGFHARQRPVLQPQRRVDPAQRILSRTQVAGVVIAVLPLPAIWINGTEQLTFVVPGKLTPYKMHMPRPEGAFSLISALP